MGKSSEIYCLDHLILVNSTYSRTTDDSGASASRRTFLTGAALALGGVGLFGGRARAAPGGTVTDLGYGGGTLYWGETRTVQQAVFEPAGSVYVTQVQVVSAAPDTSWSGMTLTFDGQSYTGTIDERTGGGTYTVFSIGRTVSSPVGLSLSVSVANGAVAVSDTDFRMRVAGFSGGTFGTVPQSGYQGDGADESIVAALPPAPPASRRRSVSRPRYSLVADRPSYLEGVDGAERVTVSPLAPRVGETVTLTVEVSNVGNREGTFTANLTNWFQILGKQSARLAPGETKTLTYEFELERAGTHRLFLTNNEMNNRIYDLRVYR